MGQTATSAAKPRSASQPSRPAQVLMSATHWQATEPSIGYLRVSMNELVHSVHAEKDKECQCRLKARCRLGHAMKKLLATAPCHLTASSAERQAPCACQSEFSTLSHRINMAERCLTPRSSRAPTACHAGPAGGTRYIFAIRARASHRRCRLNSNVRPHTNRTRCVSRHTQVMFI